MTFKFRYGMQPFEQVDEKYLICWIRHYRTVQIYQSIERYWYILLASGAVLPSTDNYQQYQGTCKKAVTLFENWPLCTVIMQCLHEVSQNCIHAMWSQDTCPFQCRKNSCNSQQVIFDKASNEKYVGPCWTEKWQNYAELHSCTNACRVGCFFLLVGRPTFKIDLDRASPTQNQILQMCPFLHFLGFQSTTRWYESRWIQKKWHVFHQNPLVAWFGGIPFPSLPGRVEQFQL